MPTSHTLTGDLSDVVGTGFPRDSVWVTIKTNLGDNPVFDSTGEQIRFPRHRFALPRNAQFSKSLWSTAALTNPTGYQYGVEVEWPDGAGGTGKKRWFSGWFSLTADKDMSELDYGPMVPPEYYPELTVARDEAVAAKTDAEAAQAAAEAAQAAAEAVGNTNDTIMAGVASDSGSAFSSVLLASYASTAVAGVSATQVVMRKLEHGESARIGVASDSTADATNEWPYLLGQLLGSDYPSHTVRWHPAAAGGAGYDAPVTIQTGSGGTPPILDVYNQSTAGTNSYQWQGANFTAQFVAPDLDLLLIAAGHNEGLFTGDPLALGHPRQQFRLRVMAVAEAVRLHSPRTQIALVAQHGWQDGLGDMGAKRDELRELAVARGYGFFDLYQQWADAPDSSSWFVDNVHLNLAGETFYAEVIKAGFRYAPLMEPRPQSPSALLETVTSLADDLVLPLGATAPLGWSASNCTISRDTTNYEGQRGYAVRLQRTAGGAESRIFRALLNSTQIAAVRGDWVTVAVRQRRPAAGLVNRFVGTVALSDGVTTSKTLGDDFSSGDFMWRVLAHEVSASATLLTASIYPDSTTDGSMADPDITVDRIVVLPGLHLAGWGNPAGLRPVRNAARFEALYVGDGAMTSAPNLDLDAATGVVRTFRFTTAGVVRWILNAQNAETGSNVGSDLLWQARTDAGGFIATAMTMKRQTGAVVFDGTHIKAPRFATASRPNAVTAGEGAQIYDTDLSKPLWSNGTAWCDATGATA